MNELLLTRIAALNAAVASCEGRHGKEYSRMHAEFVIETAEVYEHYLKEGAPQ